MDYLLANGSGNNFNHTVIAAGSEDGDEFYLIHPTGKYVADPPRYLVIVQDKREAQVFSREEIKSWSIEKLNNFAKEGYRFKGVKDCG